jgi:Arc/MetJ-type ribon-helix-helix transcriptional regulator
MIDSDVILRYYQNTMDIQLSPEVQRFIEAQLRLGLHHSPAEVIEALVQEKRGGQTCAAPEDLAARQRENILRVLEECEAISPASPKDSFSNREHDRLLYGERR